MSGERDAIVDTLRGRVLRGIHAGTLRAGDRLPSARELAAEFDVDHRVLIAAYKELEAEELVQLRPRGGAYIMARALHQRGLPPLPESWLVEVLVKGLARELPGPELHEWLRRCTETLRLRAVVIASTPEQGDGLSRELRDDYGLECEALLADEVPEVRDGSLLLRRADLLLTTHAHESLGKMLARQLLKPVIVATAMADLPGGEWSLLLRRPVYAVVETAEFGEMMQTFYSQVPGIENLRIIVYGRDDLSEIPDGAPTYVTQRVRNVLAGTRIPGRLLPAARIISTESARDIFAFIVRANIQAMSRPGAGIG